MQQQGMSQPHWQEASHCSLVKICARHGTSPRRKINSANIIITLRPRHRSLPLSLSLSLSRSSLIHALKCIFLCKRLHYPSSWPPRKGEFTQPIIDPFAPSHSRTSRLDLRFITHTWPISPFPTREKVRLPRFRKKGKSNQVFRRSTLLKHAI